MAAIDRFWSKVKDTGACWEWRAGAYPPGYGKVYANGRLVSAHRWAYEQMVADIPEGLHLDHLCCNTLCVNPYHLEPVTLAENNRRCRERRQHCRQGHAYTSENTARRKDGRRECKTCMSLRGRRNRLRRAGASRPD